MSNRTRQCRSILTAVVTVTVLLLSTIPASASIGTERAAGDRAVTEAGSSGDGVGWAAPLAGAWDWLLSAVGLSSSGSGSVGQSLPPTGLEGEPEGVELGPGLDPEG